MAGSAESPSAVPAMKQCRTGCRPTGACGESRRAAAPSARARCRPWGRRARRCARVGADCRNMNKPRGPGLARQTGEAGRRGVVHHIEALAAALAQDPDAIDHRVIAGENRLQQLLVVDTDVEETDLADIALELQEFGGAGVAGGDGQNNPAFREPLDDVAPDEPRPAEDRPSVTHAL